MQQPSKTRRFDTDVYVTEKPSTVTVEVRTRHSEMCPFGHDPKYRKCTCRKQLYIYENGKARFESAKTRSWGEAERQASLKRDERDPAKVAERKLNRERERLLAAEEQKKLDAEAKRFGIEEAMAVWVAGTQFKSRSTLVQINTIVAKVKNWAGEKNLTYLDQITPALLYEWYGGWSTEAKNKRDRLGTATQSAYLALLRRFFKWCMAVDYLVKDPSASLRRRKIVHVQTKPLTGEDQFRQILSATYWMDEREEVATGQSPMMYGRDLRAIFLLQRWTGIRIIDALMLKRTGIRLCPRTGMGLMTLATKKTGTLIKDRPLPLEVVEALNAIPVRQEHVRSGYYFWDALVADDDAAAYKLTCRWTRRIRDDLNPLLSLFDEEGEPMAFHSHMLRDTFAVELLLQDRPLEEVSRLLTHKTTQMTERYYAPWVKKRREKLHENMIAAMERMGATFTPASQPLPLPQGQPRLM